MKMTRLHQWAIIVIVTIVALFGMSSSSTASETKDITIWVRIPADLNGKTENT